MVAIGLIAALALVRVDVAWSGGTWMATGSMSTARAGHSATLLGGPACTTDPMPSYCGKVLVAGGTTNGGTALGSAELYDPRDGSWDPAGELVTARSAHTATLLQTGKVLVVGGRGVSALGGSLSTAELYDPATDAWSSCSMAAANSGCPGPMSATSGRRDHTATLLEDGRVLVVGGEAAVGTEPSAELYDPATGKFTATDELTQPRYQHTATRLLNGKVLVAGGTLPPASGGPEPTETKISSELYDPGSGSWSSCSKALDPNAPPPRADCPGDLAVARFDHSASRLGGGGVLVAGGAFNGGPRLTSERYDPATGTWSLSKYLNEARAGHGAAVLADGRVLVGGGKGSAFQSALASAEMYDSAAAASSWASTGAMGWARASDFTQPYSVPLVLLSSSPAGFEADTRICGGNCGRVLVAGGLAPGLETRLASAELYTPQVSTGPGGAGGGGGGVGTGTATPFAGCPSLTANVIRGTAASNSIIGTPRGDRIFADTGDDTVDGLAGDDCIDLGAGSDRGEGASGDDLLVGGLGRDRLSGGSGNDRLLGLASPDRLLGGGGRDRIDGGASNDRILGARSADRIVGATGNDRINGGSGNDSIKGNFGRDRLTGGSGRDRIAGGPGTDRIYARDRKRDRIDCGSGRDEVVADPIDRIARNCERVRWS